MNRFGHLVSFAAAALVGVTLVGTTAQAQTPGYYVAVPAQAATRASMMTRATPWTLAGNAYVAARAPERDAVLCELVARNTGPLAAFSVAGQAYGAAALAKCNAHAKGGSGAAEAVAAR